MIIKPIKKIVKNILKNITRIINFFNIFNIKIFNLSKKVHRIPFLKNDFGIIFSFFLKRNYLSHTVRPKYADDVSPLDPNCLCRYFKDSICVLSWSIEIKA